VDVMLDCDAGTLRFAVDGEEKSFAITEGLKGKQLRLMASSSSSACSLKLLSLATRRQ
jgi:hypothetical protein